MEFASINKKNTYYLSGGTDLNLNEEVSHNKTNYILLNRILELKSTNHSLKIN